MFVSDTMYHDVVFNVDCIFAVSNGVSDPWLYLASGGTGPHSHTCVSIYPPSCSKRIKFPGTFFNLELIVTVGHVQCREPVAAAETMPKLITRWDWLVGRVYFFVDSLAIQSYSNPVRALFFGND